jgi:hypothetical protein
LPGVPPKGQANCSLGAFYNILAAIRDLSGANRMTGVELHLLDQARAEADAAVRRALGGFSDVDLVNIIKASLYSGDEKAMEFSRLFALNRPLDASAMIGLVYMRELFRRIESESMEPTT